MTSLLGGGDNLHSYAPPSHGQVLAMCQHLEGLIRDLQTQTAELRRDFGHSDSTLGSLKAQIGNNTTSMQALQEGHKGHTVIIDNLKKDLTRTGAKMNKLGAGLEAVHDDGNALREAQKHLGADLQVSKQDINTLQDRVNTMQVQLEKEQASDNAYLKEQIRLAGAAVRDLRDDHTKTKGSLQDHAQAIRGTNASIQRVSDELSKTNTHSNTLEQRIGEQSQILKSTKQHLAETNTVALKIHEDHKGTKSALGTTQDVLKKVGAHVKQVNDVLDGTNQRLHNNTELLSRTTATMETARDKLEQTGVQVTSLDHAQQMLNSHMQGLRVHLEDTHSTLQGVKSSLKETNDIVLPNLRGGGNRPWSTAQGSMVMGHERSFADRSMVHERSLGPERTLGHESSAFGSPVSRNATNKPGSPLTARERMGSRGEVSGQMDAFGRVEGF